MDSDAKNLLGVASRYSYIGIFMGVAVAVGCFGGRWLDRHFHSDPLLMLAGTLVGIAAGFRELWRVSRQAMKESEQVDQDDAKQAQADAAAATGGQKDRRTVQ